MSLIARALTLAVEDVGGNYRGSSSVCYKCRASGYFRGSSARFPSGLWQLLAPRASDLSAWGSVGSSVGSSVRGPVPLICDLTRSLARDLNFDRTRGVPADQSAGVHRQKSRAQSSRKSGKGAGRKSSNTRESSRDCFRDSLRESLREDFRGFSRKISQ